MTTTDRPAAGSEPRRAPRVLVLALGCVVLTVLAVTVLGATLAGSPAALGASVGGGLAVLAFAFGSTTVTAAVRLAPQVALAVAMTTYLLEVVAVLAVFAALRSSGLLGDTLSPEWLAGGVVAATLVWTTSQMVLAARARVPVYDPATSREVGAP